MRFLLLSVGFFLWSAVGADAQTTSWIGTVGDWGVAGNWSDGEPTPGTDVVIPNAATVSVTQDGEACKSLTTGTLGGPTLFIDSGSLAVTGRLHVASMVSGVVSHRGGTVTAGDLLVTSPGASGSYTMTGGSLTLGSAVIGYNDVGMAGSFVQSLTSPSCTINGPLHIDRAGSWNCGAGSLTSGAVTLDGAFTLINQPTISLAAFTMSETARLSVAVGPTGVGTMMVTGTATLSGTLLVTDIGAANGTYEVLRAGAIEGSFVMESLFPDWAWYVDGNALFLTKGQVPVEATTWGGIKTLTHE